MECFRGRLLSVPQKAMRLRSAVLHIPPKSSRSRRLPFYKNRPLSTHSESTLLQLLIPLHFNSCRCNTYKKPGRGCLLPAAKFYSSSLRTRHQTRHARVAATPFLSSAYAHFPSHMGCTLQRQAYPPDLFPLFPHRVSIQRTAAPATPFLSCVYFTVPCTPGVGLCPLLSPFLCLAFRFRYNPLLVLSKETA